MSHPPGSGPKWPQNLELGQNMSGVIGQIRTSDTLLANPPDDLGRVIIDTWGIGADMQWRPCNWYGARGEFYYGQAMAEYNGGVAQSFNSATLEEIRSVGAFGEIFLYLSDAFHVHVGYGVDDPRDADLAITQIRRNQTVFTNLVWDLSTAVQLRLQVDYGKTEYTQFLPNAFLDSDAVVIASRFLWRF
jgi:hypothetical protein